MTKALLVFDDDVLLGIPALDTQHKEFYLIYNTLLGSIKQSGGEPIDLGPVIRDLHAYFLGAGEFQQPRLPALGGAEK